MKIRLRDFKKGEVDLPYLVEDVDRHGNIRLYVRRGRKVRLRETPGTKAFLEEYRAAVEAADAPKPEAREKPGRPAPGTLDDLVAKYATSREFKALVAGARRRRILDGICAERFGKADRIRHGLKPWLPMKPRHIREIRDAVEGDEAANDRLKALRAMFAWACGDGKIAEYNPARDVPYIRTGSTGWHDWTVEEIHQYEERHPVGTKARLALALLLLTGTRRSDVVRLGRQMEIEGGTKLRFTEVKNGRRRPKTREFPILPELRAVIDATPSGHLTYVVTEFGKPFTSNGFGNRMRDWCDQAGLPHCSAHGLRKAGATIAAENGATEHELMAIFGWDSPKQAAIYTRNANRKRLAAGAMHLIVPTDPKEDSPRPIRKNKK